MSSSPSRSEIFLVLLSCGEGGNRTNPETTCTRTIVFDTSRPLSSDRQGRMFFSFLGGGIYYSAPDEYLDSQESFW